ASLTRHLTSEQFVTAIIAEIHDTEVSLVSFGHPPPLLLRSDGDVQVAEPPDQGLPLGLGVFEAARAQPHRVPFHRGDRILFFTDGVIEARNAEGEFYPLQERTALLRREDPQVALDALRADLVEHVGGPLLDDAAMLLLHRPGH